VLSKEQNELLTQVGPGTPGGDLHRCYWQPIASIFELQKNPVKKVRILGENLVVYRNLSGGFGLIDSKCPHRLAGMELGIPDQQGIRCAYHGWYFNEAGKCLDTPLEPEGSKLASKVCIKSYPVQEMAGMIWGYMGKQPVPLLPHWDIFVYANCLRQIGSIDINCNWLQAQENALDNRHNQYLHGFFFKYILEREGRWNNQGRPLREMKRAITKLEAKPHPNGIAQYIERPARAGAEAYRVIHSINVFPYGNRRGGRMIRGEFTWRVPIDDTTTKYIMFLIYIPPPGFNVSHQEVVPHYEMPRFNEKGETILDCIQHQDVICWESQGPINEVLGSSDAQLVMFRRLLKEQIEVVKSGGTPINVFHDRAANAEIKLEPPLGGFNDDDLEMETTLGYDEINGDRYGPATPEVMKLIADAAAARKKSQPKSS
jgi:5,5'-dehydrodivanillate O-demethylase